MSSFDPLNISRRRWRLDIAYDGTSFRGFADQPGFDTVVGALRDAMSRTARVTYPLEIVGAGRTDAGVHAFGQVIHVDLPDPVYEGDRGSDAEQLVRSLNHQLAGRIVITRATPVSDDFHARFSATWRSYRYLVVESPHPALTLTSLSAWTVPGPLDLDAMNAAADVILGNHDFRSFCRRPAGAPGGEPLRRTVLAAAWRRLDDEWGITIDQSPVLRFDIRANAFCHQMVRSLTSAMVAVGRGKLDVREVVDRLENPDRTGLPSPAPAGGLSLIGVGYPELAGGASGFVS